MADIFTNPNLINNAKTPRAKVDTSTGSRSTAQSTFTQPYVGGENFANMVDNVGKLANQAADNLAVKKATQIGTQEQIAAGTTELVGAGSTPLTTFLEPYDFSIFIASSFISYFF